MNNDNRGGFFSGFIAGAIAGAALAAAFTREETRDVFVGKAREAGNRAMDATGDLRGRAAEIYERGKTLIDQARSNINAAVDEGRANAEHTREHLSRHTSA